MTTTDDMRARNLAEDAREAAILAAPADRGVYRRGERYLLTIPATVHQDRAGGALALEVGSLGGATFVINVHPHDVALEPYPEYSDGTVIRAADGNEWVRRDGGWLPVSAYFNQRATPYADNRPVRPLTVLAWVVLSVADVTSE